MGRRIIILVLALMFLCVMPVSGATPLEYARFIEIEVNPATPVSNSIACGYVEVNVTVVNRQKDPATVELKTNIATYSNISGLSRTTVVPGNSTVQVPLYIPLAGVDINYISANVNGRNGGNVPFSMSTNYYNSQTLIMLSQSMQMVEPAWRNFANAALAGGSTGNNQISINGHEYVNIEPKVHNIQPESWSSNWLAYTGYAGLIVSSADMQKITDSVRAALYSYVETGGVLVVVGNYQPESGWYEKEENASFGRVYSRGFGVLLNVNITEPMQWSDIHWSALDEHWRVPWFFDFDKRGNVGFGLSDVVAGNRIPVGMLFIILLAFVILAGPVNSFVFARGVKRMRIYWIVPVCSLAATAVIVITALAAEGITPNLRTSSVVYLNENSKSSAIMALTGYYCPVPPSELLFDNDIMVADQNISRNEYSSRMVDYTKGQSYTGWINARVQTYFASKSSKVCRDHLVVRTEADGGVSVVNNLPGKIKNLVLCTTDGRRYTGANIASGTSVVLTPMPADGELGSDLRTLYLMTNWQNANPSFPVPGTYAAVLDGDPYTQTGLGDAKVKYTGQNCVVYGVMEK